ncbi:MAG: hypothetical protein F6J97_25900, partial [Leptolyngbya sp. SIO4C1]|nr:hypothetical protein [Leptolyngbya sp. SIO4C1]
SAALSHSQIRIEYPLTVNQWLKGTLDYLLQASQSFLVSEAKNDDLSRGFTQLATELIAIAEVEDLPQFYGAVTIGDAWRFGRLDTNKKHIVQDIALYAVPTSLEKLLRILLGILTGKRETVADR